MLDKIETSTIFKDEFNFSHNIEIRDLFFNKLKDIPDLDKISGLQYELDKIIEKTEKLPFSWIKDFLYYRLDLEKKYSDKKDIRISPIPQFLEIRNWVSFNKSSDEEILNEIFQLNSNNTLTGYFLPELVVDLVDSESITTIVKNKINIIGIDELSLWIRFAGKYNNNSKPWRKIAIEALIRVVREGNIDIKRIYALLQSTGIKSWSTAPGTVAGLFYNDVKIAEKNLKEEENKYLIKFWEWNLKVAKETLEQEKGRIEEEE